MACDKSKTREAVSRAFDEVDTNHNGFLEAGEVERVLQLYYKQHGKPCDANKCKKDTQELIKALDKNHDHKISKEEFVSFVVGQCH